jgi:hypothetical protein
MARKLYFQQITDSRFENEEDCLPILNKRIEKLKKLLDIENVNITVSNPRLLEWGKAEGAEEHIQYRADFIIEKKTRKVTWNDIYKMVNSVKAVPYKFI